MGLGDKGTEGIDEFKRQHTCNSICKELQLPDISQEDEAQAPVEPADNLEYITKSNDGANKKTPEGKFLTLSCKFMLISTLYSRL
jgi:hypothetical protein